MIVWTYNNATLEWEELGRGHTLRVTSNAEHYALTAATKARDGVTGLRVHGQRALVIVPEVSNSIIITPREGNQ